jgi:hypothetical protein
MADENQQQENSEPLENEQWKERQWSEEQAYGKETIVRQQAEIEKGRASAEAEQNRQAAEAQEGQGSEESAWASRLAIAKNGERVGGPNGGENNNGERLIEDFPELIKKADVISKKIKEEKKKTGTDYFLIYFILTVFAAFVDVIDLVCDLIEFDVGIITSPIYSTFRYLGIKYANSGMTSKEHEQMTLIVTIISGAISLFGLPSNTVAMFMEFAARKKIANDATAEIKKLEKQRDKLLGPDLVRQYRPRT